MASAALELPGDDDPVRAEVRAWLEAHPRPSGRELADAGLVAPHWPRPWGRDADPLTQLVIDDELRRAGVTRPMNPIGLGWAGPTIVYAGTETQKERWLRPMLSGEETWCQLFSEPDAGSDLASLRTTARRDGDEWVVNGQKVWTSLAHMADYGILLARTNDDAPKHRGISYFVCPMHVEGVTVRPIVDMTGAHAFNAVFLDEVRLPAHCLVGEEGQGWGLARVTLGNERVSLSGEGSLWGRGPTAADLVALVGRPSERRVTLPATSRARLVRTWIEGEVLGALRLKSLSALMAGRDPGPTSSVRKALADDHGQRVMNLARDMAGAYGTLAPRARAKGSARTSTAPPCADREWATGFLYSRALTIGGGTAEVQRNIIAERLLGLPRERHGEEVDERAHEERRPRR